MFKNEINFTQSHPLSKKEKKEIFKSLKNIFKEEYLNIMSNSFKDLTIHKGNIQNKKRNVIFEGSNPILFEYDKEVYYPTVYLLQLFNAGIGENIIENFALIYDATVEYIINGADLMLKGVINRENIKNNDKLFKLGDLFYIQTVTGYICGVGTSLIDKKLMNLDTGGKFLRVLHKIDDSLYNLGDKKELKPLIEQKKIEFEDKKENIEEIKNEINEENKKEGEKKENNLINEINDNIEDIKLESNEKGEEEEEEKENAEEQQEQEEKVSKEEIDENLDIIFLTLCKLHLQNEKFPMDPGKLYHDFMKPLSIEMHKNINIKFSSYKKVNDYFKYLSKEKNLVSFSKAKGQNNFYISKINYENDIIKDFKPRISKIKFLSKNKNQENKQAENILLSSEKKIEIKTLYKPNQKLHPLFSKYIKDFEPNKHYDLKVCKNVLVSYIKEKNLFSNEVNKVKVDDYLKEILKIKEDKFYEFGKDYDIAEILEYF